MRLFVRPAGRGGAVNERQSYALAHVVTDPTAVTQDPRLKAVRSHPRGFLLLSILAVDR